MSVRRYSLDNFRFRQPRERIFYVKLATEKLGDHPAEARQGLGIRGSTCAGADNLGDWRQVQAGHPVFKETEAVFAKKLGCYRSEGGEQKGPCPVRLLSGKPPVDSCPDGDVENAVRSKPISQLSHEVFLGIYDFG
jgi:hypothetical protein